MNRIHWAVVLGLLAGCSDGPTGPLASPADFEGVVGQVRLSLPDPQLYVEQVTRPKDGSSAGDVIIHLHYADAGMTMEHPAAVFQEGTAGIRPASTDGLMEGQRVQIWTTGEEARSLPPQYDARQIVVIERR